MKGLTSAQEVLMSRQPACSVSQRSHSFRASRRPPQLIRAQATGRHDSPAAETPEQPACSRRSLLAVAAAAAAYGAVSVQPAPAAAASRCSVPSQAGAAFAASRNPVWETAAVTENIKQAPQETSQLLPASAIEELGPAETRALELNQRIQQQNAAPLDFPAFVREGFNVKVMVDGYEESPEGLIYREFFEGSGELPQDGQEVVFDYTAYNEQGRRIDTSYQKGQPARTRLGIQGLIPGFELGLKTMRVGGKRRLVVPPQLGPPTGPSTFFSAKQCEVFDVELRAVRNCRRRQVAMFSDVVCE